MRRSETKVGLMDTDDSFSIRDAVQGDEGLICTLLGEFAAFEKAPIFRLDEAAVARDLLGEDRAAQCGLAFLGEEPAGVMVWFWSYRSFRAQRGLFVEDIYVRPQFRGQGIGKALLAYLAAAAQCEGAFLEWLVLDWNSAAIDFYSGLGAAPVPQWQSYRLEGDALAKLAGT
jgi:GNAT superfamily N-acetyltransferase